MTQLRKEKLVNTTYRITTGEGKYYTGSEYERGIAHFTDEWFCFWETTDYSEAQARLDYLQRYYPQLVNTTMSIVTSKTS